jgi:hypothetical protein
MQGNKKQCWNCKSTEIDKHSTRLYGRGKNAKTVVDGMRALGRPSRKASHGEEWLCYMCKQDALKIMKINQQREALLRKHQRSSLDLGDGNSLSVVTLIILTMVDYYTT